MAAAATVDQPPAIKPAPAKSEGAPLDRAQALIHNRQDDEAIALLRSVVASAQAPSTLAEAYLLLGTAFSNKGDYAQAADYLDRLLADHAKTESAGPARPLLGMARTKLGKIDAALSVLSEARELAGSPEEKQDVLRLIGEAYVAKKDYVRAIQSWIEEMNTGPDAPNPIPRERIKDLIHDRIDKPALTRLRDRFPSEFPGDLILIRLFEIHDAAGEEHLAEKDLRLFLVHFPQHEFAGTATDYLKAHKSKVKGSQHVIAALLPTSGRLAPYGLEALNGIKLALEKGQETGLGTVGLVVKDSGTQEKGSLKSDLQDLIGDYRPFAVIGPMLSRHLPIVAVVAEETEVPFLSPAVPDGNARRFGTYVFTTALTYAQQAKRLAEYAVVRLGHKKFCVLHAESPYGQELARQFMAEVRARGGDVLAVESFPDGDTDFGAPIKRLKAEDLKRGGTQEPVPTSKGGTRLVYTPGFDALFLAGSSNQVALAASQLRFYDVKTPLLGSNAWNSPEVLRVADRAVEGSVFVDSLFLDSPDAAVREFIDRYRRKHQAAPTLFAAQAYDATRLVLEAVKRGATSGRAVRDQLLKLQDLPTLSGPAAFGPGGALERPVTLIQVKQGKFVQVD